jgi:uncharacterized protein
VLGLLSNGARSGYDIKAIVDRSTRFFWAASYGQIYPELGRLERAGLIEGEEAPTGGRRRRVYELMPAGRGTPAMLVLVARSIRMRSTRSAVLRLQRRRRSPHRVRVMEQRVSLVTLGVSDLERAREFYQALGWKTNAAPGADVVFFQAGGMILALWGREELAADSAVEDRGGFGGVTLAHNVRSPAEVDRVVEEARRAGATITREPAETFWGGYAGVFADPDGHPWEVAHNPRWTIEPDGSVTLGSNP